jgi:hypothetical protein
MSINILLKHKMLKEALPIDHRDAIEDLLVFINTLAFIGGKWPG